MSTTIANGAHLQRPDDGGDGAGPEDDPRISRAIALAERLLAESLATASRAERRRLARLGRLVDDPRGRQLVQLLTDDVLRIHEPARAARRFGEIVDGVGAPPSLATLDRVLLRTGARAATRLPRLVMPLVVRRIRQETKGVVLSSRDPAFANHVRRRTEDGVALNINVLGEAILSDAEADDRFAAVRSRLARPDVDYVSVKISAICANLDPVAFDDSVARVSERLRVLYRDAISHRARSGRAKFVNLDMEEFKDLALTVAAFTTVLDEDEFGAIDAGIVLQAYLPDSHAVLDHLGEWAVRRRTRSGGRIKVRLVKGANLAMEQVDAELHGWNQAPYPTKADVDASYKRLLDSALRPEWADAVRVGLASHNLFDVAWGLVLRDELADPSQLSFEMLEGMAPAQSRAVNAAAGGLLLYAPVASPDDIDSSIAYLSRRLDENTAPDNFLRALFHLRPGSPELAHQADLFRAAVRRRHTIETTSRRASTAPVPDASFTNEPDSDLTLPQVRDHLLAAAARLSDLPPVPAAPTVSDVDAIVKTARAAAERWRTSTRAERAAVLVAAAQEMARDRGVTLEAMATEAGKTWREGDPEVSEAIDFARYYATAGSDAIDTLVADGVRVTGRGVVLVVAPWNFPYAIPCGGVCAALAAGNSVILKPAPETRRTAWLLADQLWRAGVPRDLLQFVACEDDEVGRHLVTHDGVDTVVLTGAYETAQAFLEWKPTMRLLAETSGKNALVVTAAADVDAALQDLVRSAFGHAGQKCSAASLAIVEAPLYDDPVFRRRLAAAVESVVVGWGIDRRTTMGPLIKPPSGPLLRALTTLEPGEEWLVEPRPLDTAEPTTARLWFPGVRLGVQGGSWFHMTECFGPVLGVMRAVDLDDAIRLQNMTPYGLTAGLHSLDPLEVRHWAERVEAGNAYVNRHITGAVVQRQPFGGWKRSAVGCGAKAGGPDYVLALSSMTGGDEAPADVARWRERWFALGHDPSGLVAETNLFRYRPLGRVAVRIDATTDPADVAIAEAAAAACGVTIEVSDARQESDSAFRERLAADPPERVRDLAAPSSDLRLWLMERGIAHDPTPVVHHGRAELTRWLKEQAISETTHRHGRLVASALVQPGG